MRFKVSKWKRAVRTQAVTTDGVEPVVLLPITNGRKEITLVLDEQSARGIMETLSKQVNT